MHHEIVKRTTTPTSFAKPFDLMSDFAATERQHPNVRTKPSSVGDGGGALAFDLEATAVGNGEAEGERIAAAIKRDLSAEVEKREALSFASAAAAADGGEESVRRGKKARGKKGTKKGKKSGASTARGPKKEVEAPQIKKRSQSFPYQVGGKRKLLTEDAVCAGDRRALVGEGAVCAGERRVLDRDELKCAGDKKQRLIDEETQCAGQRKFVNPDDRTTAGVRPKARFTEDTQVKYGTAL